MEKKQKFGFMMAAPDRYAILKEFARENRRKMTLSETILWEQLRQLPRHCFLYFRLIWQVAHAIGAWLDGGTHPKKASPSVGRVVYSRAKGIVLYQQDRKQNRPTKVRNLSCNAICILLSA